jgi:drug/metabolite transporter (DMT)-like permease
MSGKPPRAAVLSVAAAALLWSSGGLFIKIAPMPALAVACGRAIVTTVFYLLVFRPDLRRARLSTSLVYATTVVTFVASTRLTTAANAIFLQYTGPAWVLALSPWLLDEKFRRIDGICVALSLVGLSFFFVGKIEPGQFTGNLVAVFSGVFFALTILFIRRDAKGGASDPMPSMTLGNAIAALGTLPFAAGSLLHVTAQGALVLAYLGVVQLGLSYWLFVRGMRSVPAAEGSLISMLEPVCNPIWVFLGTAERPGPLAILGGAIVLGAVVLRTAAKEPTTEPAAPT